MVKNIFIFTILFSAFLTQQSQAMKCELYVTHEDSNNKFMNEINDKIEVKNGVGRFIEKIPKSFEGIFLDEQDFSIEVIKENARQSYTYWSQTIPLEQIKHFKTFNFDWITYQELTLKTDQIWNKMIECNLKQTTSELRKNYFLGKPCSITKDAEEIHKEISELTLNFVNFVSSTNPIFFNIHNCEDLECAKSNSSFKLPYQHPLLSQITVQTWATLLNLIIESKREDTYMLGDLIDALIYNVKYDWKINSDAKRVSWAKWQFNVAQMIQSLSNECHTIGLWPAINRVLFFTGSTSYSTQSEPLSSLMRTAAKNSEKSCGTKIQFLQGGHGTYSNFSTAHVFTMRKLFAIYYPEKENSLYKSLMEKSDFKTFNKLVCE